MGPATGGEPKHAAPAVPVAGAPADSAADLERAGRAGLHPLMRRPQQVHRGVRRLVGEVPAPFAVLGEGDDAPALLTRLYAMVVRDGWGGGGGDTVHVMQLTPWYACDIGYELVGAGRILGENPKHRDLTPERPDDPPGPDDDFPAAADAPPRAVVSLRRPECDFVARRLVGDASRVVVVADTSRADRQSVAGCFAALSRRRIPVTGLVVYRGRIPRDPAFGR